MTASITPNQLVSLVHRLIHLSCWLIFYVFHIGLLTIIVTALYLSGTTGADIYNYFLPLAQSFGLEATSSIISFFGISGFALLMAYALLIKKLFVKYSLNYLYKHIEENGIQ